MSRITLQVALLSLFENVVRRIIELDRYKCRHLKSLAGCAFQIDMTEPDLSAYIIIDSMGRPNFHTIHSGEVTTRVCGSASQFLKLVLSEDPGAELVNSSIEIEGNSNQLLMLNHALKNLNLDWEAHINQYVGDIIGHKFSNLIRETNQWRKTGHRSLMRQIKEYIYEEARFSPSKMELEDYYEDIQNLTFTVDRLTSQITKLNKTY